MHLQLAVIRFGFDFFSRAAESFVLRVLTAFAFGARFSFLVDWLVYHVGHRVVTNQVVINEFPVGDVMRH